MQIRWSQRNPIGEALDWMDITQIKPQLIFPFSFTHCKLIKIFTTLPFPPKEKWKFMWTSFSRDIYYVFCDWFCDIIESIENVGLQTFFITSSIHCLLLFITFNLVSWLFMWLPCAPVTLLLKTNYTSLYSSQLSNYQPAP
jgi:hypothetical protein